MPRKRKRGPRLCIVKGRSADGRKTTAHLDNRRKRLEALKKQNEILPSLLPLTQDKVIEAPEEIIDDVTLTTMTEEKQIEEDKDNEVVLHISIRPPNRRTPRILSENEVSQETYQESLHQPLTSESSTFIETADERSDTGIDTSKDKASSDLDIWEPSIQGSNDILHKISDNITNEQFRAMFIDTILRELRMYTGIPKENHEILDVLEEKSALKKYFIYLTLYKMKTNDSFEKIGDLFGVSKTYASEMFQQTCIILLKFMKDLVFWPTKLSTEENLPIQFTFSVVQTIIDCLEIEIEKPSLAKGQALTWSNYKKCNTVKYLISSTPDGFINFVSVGYGGDVSDGTLFEDCGLLSVLPENTVVIADRGFKNIGTFLQKKNCTLVIPSTFANKHLMTKDNVPRINRMASVRIHMERIIKQIREFKILEQNGSVNLELVQKLDDIIIIACGIINLQKPISKPYSLTKKNYSKNI